MADYRDEMKWVIYNVRTNIVWKRFYLEEDAKKKLKRIIRERGNRFVDPDEFVVEHIGDVSLAAWKMWKQLQANKN